MNSIETLRERYELYKRILRRLVREGHPLKEAEAMAKKEAAKSWKKYNRHIFSVELKEKGRQIYKPTVKEKEEEDLYGYLSWWRGLDEKTALKIVSARGNPTMEQLENENMVAKRRARKKR